MDAKLNPRALAQMYDNDTSPDVQAVTAAMIRNYVMAQGMLPGVSAQPFATWLNEVWYEFVGEDGTTNNGDVIQGALAFWRGQ